jgi:hypothetical protein
MTSVADIPAVRKTITVNTSVRTAVDSSGGWSSLLEMFKARAEQKQ